MRILKEETDVKENLPVSFITDMMSKGWDEVGYLREASAAIKEEYNGTAKVEELMQDLMDAYLVFLGQLEAYLNKEEDITTNIEPEETPKPKKAAAKIEDEEKELPEAEIDIEPIEEVEEEEEVPVVATPAAKATPSMPVVAEDPFDFFVDFDEPDMTQPRLTDDELYGHEDSEYEHNKLRSLLS